MSGWQKPYSVDTSVKPSVDINSSAAVGAERQAFGPPVRVAPGFAR